LEILLASALLVSLYIVNGSLIQHPYIAIHPFLGVLRLGKNVIVYEVEKPKEVFLCFGNGTPTKSITYMNSITNMEVMPTG
jgi:hypothetical protein